MGVRGVVGRDPEPGLITVFRGEVGLERDRGFVAAVVMRGLASAVIGALNFFGVGLSRRGVGGRIFVGKRIGAADASSPLAALVGRLGVNATGLTEDIVNKGRTLKREP